MSGRRSEFLGRGTVSMTLRCTVVHACPEYLRGDRLNYFRVPLGVNVPLTIERSIIKAPVNSVDPPPPWISLFPRANSRADVLRSQQPRGKSDGSKPRPGLGKNRRIWPHERHRNHLPIRFAGISFLRIGICCTRALRNRKRSHAVSFLV